MMRRYSKLTRSRMMSALALFAFGLLCLAAPPVVADFETGKKAYIEGDYEKAKKIWLAAGNAGDGESLYFAAMTIGTTGDPRYDAFSVFDLLHRAAELGDPRAQAIVGFNLGISPAMSFLPEVSKEQAEQLAFSWLMRAALGGSVSGYEGLAIMYCNGIFVDQDHDLASAWAIVANEDNDLSGPLRRYRTSICSEDAENDPVRREHLRLRALALRLALGLPPKDAVLADLPPWFE